MVLSREFYDYEMSLVQVNPNTGKLDLNHIDKNDPRIKKLRKLAIMKEPNENKSKKLPKVVKIINRKQQFYDYEDVDWDVIKSNRAAKNLTQHEVATIAGMARTVYQQYETGRLRASKNKIIAICDALELEIIEIKRETKRVKQVNCEFLKKKRIEFGYKQGEFARIIGASQSRYSDYENGKAVWNEKVLKKTCELLEIDYKDVTMNAR
ncbi:hypothetical protein BKP56_07105 [Marinilactibacillus sp. 15R]|uniref:helix-turn-helix domain-containing protein n=1 Tax=Marinilactibacillus sp. 15R TaxID=1911586 RepID=UPI00090AE8AB|nr:helix-turn-helix transcriptional regulator [Marinilactibacillus sp. 15R]API89036.1 hypothetical protein BKP56_07105 [Marinilactibacillus sp. 15R]